MRISPYLYEVKISGGLAGALGSAISSKKSDGCGEYPINPLLNLLMACRRHSAPQFGDSNGRSGSAPPNRRRAHFSAGTRNTGAVERHTRLRGGSTPDNQLQPQKIPLCDRRDYLARRRLLGLGTYGRVYRYCASNDATPIAVKEIIASSQFSVSPDLIREIGLLQLLNGMPGVISYHRTEYAPRSGCMAVIMNCAKGTLYSWLQTAGKHWRWSDRPIASDGNSSQSVSPHPSPSPSPELYRIPVVENDYGADYSPAIVQYGVGLFRQLVAAVASLHHCGVIHGDLKPQNILLAESPEGHLHVLLADFGLALPYQGMVVPNNPIVTIMYRAPELLLQNSEEDPTKIAYNAAIDIWALGCCLFEILTGYHLFYGLTAIDQLLQIYLATGGLPNYEAWPGVALYPDWHYSVRRYQSAIKIKARHPGQVLIDCLTDLGHLSQDISELVALASILLEGLLKPFPRARLTAAQTLLYMETWLIQKESLPSTPTPPRDGKLPFPIWQAPNRRQQRLGRTTVYSWMLELLANGIGSDLTFLCAMMLIDDYHSQNPVPPADWRLTAIVALGMMCKALNHNDPGTTRLIELTGGYYTRAQYLALERTLITSGRPLFWRHHWCYLTADEITSGHNPLTTLLLIYLSYTDALSLAPEDFVDFLRHIVPPLEGASNVKLSEKELTLWCDLNVQLLTDLPADAPQTLLKTIQSVFPHKSLASFIAVAYLQKNETSSLENRSALS